MRITFTRLNCIAILLLVFGLFPAQIIHAQTPTDAVMMDAGYLCIDANYDFIWWHKYWEGTLLRDNANIGTLQKHTITPMLNLGILNWLNFMVAAPYVITHPTAGQIEGTHGLPDLNFWLKAEPFRKHLGPGTFNILATVGFTVPVTNYAPDYTYAIGMRCPEGSFKLITQYKLDAGLYIRAHGGYMIRGNSKLQHDYYYTTQAYYSNLVDMPNAVDYSGAVGYFSRDKQYKAEIKLDGMNTLGGFDIRRQDMMFPSNKINFVRIGARFEYYPVKAKGLGIHLTGGYILAGRNYGRCANIGAGINFAPKLWTPGKLAAARKAKKKQNSSSN